MSTAHCGPRITGLRRFLFTDGGRPAVYVKIEAEGGLWGVGEATINAAPRAVAGLLDDLGALLLGHDATRIEFLWQHAFRRLFYRGGPVFGAALSGVDQALWDLNARTLGVPVYRLLGGLARDRVRLYVHIGGKTPEAAVRSAAEAVAAGFTAVRFSPVQSHDSEGIHDHAQAVRTAVRQMAAIREAVGDQVAVLLECHGRFDPEWAIALARQVEPYHPFLIEDPIRPENTASMARVRERTGLPLALGERAHSKWEFREMIEDELVNYIRPDVCHCGGITEMKKIAALAEAHQINLIPHNVAGPLGTAAGLHAALAIPNVAMLEAPWAWRPGETGVTGPLPTVETGYALPPEGVGLGVTFDEEAAARGTFTPRPLPEVRALDGSVRDW